MPAVHPPIAHIAQPVAVHPPIAHIAQPVAVHPPIAHIAQPVAAHPPIAHIAQPVAVHPPIAHIAQPVVAHPPIAHIAQPVAVHPPIAHIAQPVAVHPPIAHIAQPVAVHPPIAHIAQPVAVHPPIAHIAQPVAVHPPIAHIAQPVAVHPPIAHIAQPVAAHPPIAQPVAAHPPIHLQVTELPPTAHTNTTLNPAAAAIGGFVKGIMDKIPLPLWAIYTISVVGALLILLCCICICKKCCCRGKKKKKNQNINQNGLNGKTSTALVQPDVADAGYGSTKQRGKLLYSLDYNAAESVLSVGIKEADSLMAMDLGGSSDPYVKVYTCPDKSKTFETKVFRNTLNPAFNERFSFQISKSSLLRSTVVMQIFDFNRFSKHHIIGELRVPLSSVDWSHVIEEWQNLAEPNMFQEEHLGEICFSLRFVPTASKLTVVVLEAKNLKTMDIGGSSDPYVKVQLALDKRKWRKRKTSVKKKTLNPYYNESFTFDVTFDQIQRVNLVLSVWDQDTVSRNDAMGKIFLGGDASGNQLRHWADMLSSPRRPVAQWHHLLSAEQVNSTLVLKRRIPLRSRMPF
ncbi:synaptotagmin VIII [Cyclopterus lumpus]|uniref:Synaptotagmin 8 n=1 Tax=Cyclopterus lumpus TaxID=8103 RepID=A0A8C2X676_CYCLU|nr:synaptotagmin VIII [Cyclopterus lumpus]